MKGWKVIASVIGAALLVALLAAGVVLAQEPTPTPGPSPVPGVAPCFGGLGFRWGHRLQGLADVLGMTPGQLLDAILEGKTVAQIAQEQGVSLDSLVEKFMEPLQERASKMVEEGYITQEAADEWLSIQRQLVEWKLKYIKPGQFGGQGQGKFGTGYFGLGFWYRGRHW